MNYNEAIPRINGALLSKFQNQNVCLLGRVNHIDSNGNTFRIATSDDQNVTIRMRQPLTDAVSDVVEVQGIVRGSDVECLNLVTFNHNGPKPFNMKCYDKAVKYMHKYPECYDV